MAAHPGVLCPQDTTALDCNGQAIAGLGPLIDGSRARWEVELRFLVLKAGCRIEARQPSTMARLERAWALFLVVAGCIARLVRLGRTRPDLDAALLLESDEWQAAYLLAQKPRPQQPPRLNAVVRLIAGLGGFLGRKGDGEPGVKTIWLGRQRVMDFAAGIKFASRGAWGMTCVYSPRNLLAKYSIRTKIIIPPEPFA